MGCEDPFTLGRWGVVGLRRMDYSFSQGEKLTKGLDGSHRRYTCKRTRTRVLRDEWTRVFRDGGSRVGLC